MNTNGYVPARPLNQSIYPGDFFQVRNGEMIVLGNIFRQRVVDPDKARIEQGITLNSLNWSFSEGVSKPYAGRSSGEGAIEGEFTFSRQIFAFNDRGSFIFRAHSPELNKIANWSDMQQELIIRLTTILFSFRELYIATEVVTASSWALAVSGSSNGELEIATMNESFGLTDIFGHEESKTIQSRDIEYYHRKTMKKPVFFKAKRLTVQDEKLEVFISDLISRREQHDDWISSFFGDAFHFDDPRSRHVPSASQASVIEMLQVNELNPNTALLYFKWTDMNLDDIEKMFLTYGS